MSLKPIAPQWFEVLVAKEDYLKTMQVLAATEQVEIEGFEHSDDKNLIKLNQLFQDYVLLRKQYQDYWPKPDFSTIEPHLDIFLTQVEAALKALQAWQIEAQESLSYLQNLEQSSHDLLQWQALLQALPSTTQLNLSLLKPDNYHYTPLFILLEPEIELSFLAKNLYYSFDIDSKICVLVLIDQDQKEAIYHQVKAVKGQILEVPIWFNGDKKAIEEKITLRLEGLTKRKVSMQKRLNEIDKTYDLQTKIGVLERLSWFETNRKTLIDTQHLMRITGWFSPKEISLVDTLEKSNIVYLLHNPKAPESIKRPSILKNPLWSKPFEVFARAIGVPQHDEIDPSMLLAIIMPLMFGYMFGDVGQGLVLIAVAYTLRNIWKLAPLMRACGISTIIFGFLYGKLFALPILPALWLHPLEHPLTLMIIPLIFAFLLLSAGLVMNALQAYWRYGLKPVIGVIGLLLLYYGLMGALFSGYFLYLSIIGLFLIIGHEGLKHSFKNFAESIEMTLQLLLNTLSFVRIGAFSLAHAGLAAAVVSLSQGLPWYLALIILILGNILIIVLEGMVVSIQATRLILFEFFIRFFHGEGRIFKPIPAPPM